MVLFLYVMNRRKRGKIKATNKRRQKCHTNGWGRTRLFLDGMERKGRAGNRIKEGVSDRREGPWEGLRATAPAMNLQVSGFR